MDKVYPDMVVRDRQGEIESVRYYELLPMLLNEVQKQHRDRQALKETIDAQALRIRQQQRGH